MTDQEIDAAVEALSPFDEPMRSVWQAVSAAITDNADHLCIAEAALKAAMKGVRDRPRYGQIPG